MSSSQRIGSVAALVQEGDEGRLEVEVRSPPASLLELARRAGEERARRRPARPAGRRSARPPGCCGSRRRRSCPRRRGRRMNSHRRSRWRGSSAALGSSSSSTSGSASRPIAMFTRWRLPPESVADLIVGAIVEVGLARASARRPRRTSGTRSSRANSAQVLGHGELRRRAPPAGAPSRPRSGDAEIVPASGRWMPARIDSSVVLPAPFGPITATSSPRAGGRAKRRAAPRRSPKRLTRLARLERAARRLRRVCRLVPATVVGLQNRVA